MCLCDANILQNHVTAKLFGFFLQSIIYICIYLISAKSERTLSDNRTEKKNNSKYLIKHHVNILFFSIFLLSLQKLFR